ncbi:MAG TPA: DUF1153 domain-containing protein [Rhizomicrobium sp.]|jgi:hypothetical protein|nr:DUF1153 domain-containing protein [Rhizomicrobium sp.]
MGLAENNFVKTPAAAPSTLGIDLPSPQTKRWVPRRKAQVVAAVRGGVLSLDEACHRYALTVEEFLSWQRALDRFGIEGLCITHAQEHRTLENRAAR